MHLKTPFVNIACIEKSIGLTGDVVISLNSDISFFSFDILKILAFCPLHVVPPLNPNDGPRILHIKTIDGVEVQEYIFANSAHENLFSACSSFRVYFEEIDSIQKAKLICGHYLFTSYTDIKTFDGDNICQCVSATKRSESKSCIKDSAQQKSVTARNTTAKDALYDKHLSTKELFEHNVKITDQRYGNLGVLKSIIETPANDVWVIHGKYGEVLIPVVEECANSFIPNEKHTVYTHIIDGLIDEDFAKE